MPTCHIELSGGLPMSGNYDYREGIFVLPTGIVTPAIQSRLLADALTVLDGQIIHIPNSGVLAIASGLNDWVGLELA